MYKQTHQLILILLATSSLVIETSSALSVDITKKRIPGLKNRSYESAVSENLALSSQKCILFPPYIMI